MKGHITLPYVGYCSDAIARRIRKAGVAVHMKPTNTIRSRLVHPKDKIPKDQKCGVVYHVECADCNNSYVGETARSLKSRLKEHRQPPSHVGQHLKEAKHHFEEQEVAVLHQEANWFKRGVAEAFHIEQQRPTLNQDRGRHTLPVIYRELTTNCDQRPVKGSTSGSQTIASLATQ